MDQRADPGGLHRLGEAGPAMDPCCRCTILANELHVYDNSDAARPYRLVACYRDGQLVMPSDRPIWAPAELRALHS